MNILLNALTAAAAGLGIYICWKLVLSLLMEVPAYTSVLLINVFTNKVRACGSGLRLIWPWEKTVDDSQVKMTTVSHSFSNEFETQNESVVSLKIAFDLIPDEKHLIEHRRFDSATRLNGVTERIKAILTKEVRKLKNRDEVMDNYKALADEIKKRFEEAVSEDGKRLEEYYGVNLKNLVISNTDLPPALKEAATAKEVMEKTNQTRGLEMTKLKQMARTLVKESEAKSTPMPFEKAMEIVQLQFGKGNVSKDIKIFGLDRGTLEVAKAIAEGVLGGKR